MSVEVFKQGLELFADQWQAPGSIDFYSSGDLDDYISFSVTSNRPLITGVGNYLVIGKDGTAGSATSADDVLVGGKLEVDGVLYADGGITGALTMSTLTAGRVVIVGTGGLLADDADFTFAVDTLTVTKIGATTLAGAVAGGDQAFTGVGDMTFTAGSILKSGGTNTDTLLIAANDTTFITLTTAATDVCTLNNITMSGTWLASGTVTLPAVTLGGTISGAAQVLSNLGTVYIGATSNAKMTLGLTIDQAGNYDEAIGLKGLGVAHGCTEEAETNTYGNFKVCEQGIGGLRIMGFKDSGAPPRDALSLYGVLAENSDTTKSTAGRAIVETMAFQVTGVGLGNIVADGNVFAVRARVSGGDITCMIVDEDGDLWLNGGITTTSPIILQAGSTLEKAISGDIVLECSPATAGTSAATLNAAAVGTHTQVVTINLKDAAGNLHKWATLAVAAATSEVVVDVDVAAPAVNDATPNLANGTVNVTLTYDTDAGATKVYAAGDTVTLTVSQPTGGILGYPISNATFVDTIVA